jgi:hypothetical protein
MKSVSLDVLKQIVDANGKLDSWNFSRVRAGHDPVLWDYVDVVRQYLKPLDQVLDIGTGAAKYSFHWHHILVKASALTKIQQ